MGTDVYLEWNRKSEADDNKQAENVLCTGGGNVGYLRASIHMQNENTILRMLFPDKYWQRSSKEEYDFIGNWDMLAQLVPVYLKAVESGSEIVFSGNTGERQASLKKRTEAITSAISTSLQAVGKDIEISCPHTEDIADAAMWLRDVLDFFQLGAAKQKKGLKPYPYISW